MKTVDILYEHCGEISYTRLQPRAPWTGQVNDLDETKQACYSSDDWRTVPVKRWDVRACEMPDWLSPEAYCNGWHITLTWLEAFGADLEWPEPWLRELADFGRTPRLAAIKLLKTKKFRSDFRKSLRAQLETWLDTPVDDRKFPSPFSQRQWDALCNGHIALEAKRIDQSTYNRS